MKYRLVKLKLESGEEYWAVQKEFKSWLTGRPFWKYMESDWNRIVWTRRPDWAAKYVYKKDAEEQITKLLRYDGRRVSAVTVVKEIERETGTDNIYVRHGEE